MDRERSIEQVMAQSGASRQYAERAIDRLAAQVEGKSCPVCEAGYADLCPKHS